MKKEIDRGMAVKTIYPNGKIGTYQDFINNKKQREIIINKIKKKNEKENFK